MKKLDALIRLEILQWRDNGAKVADSEQVEDYGF